MKYKNRLIIPTLVSTSLLASTIVANADEVDQDEQYSGQSTEEYAVDDETSDTDLDFIESEDETLEEESEENSDEVTDETEEAEDVDNNTLDKTDTELADETPENVQSSEASLEAIPDGNKTEEDVSVEPEVQETEEPSVESETTVTAETVEVEVVEENTPAETSVAAEVEESLEEPAESEQNSEEPVEAAAAEPVEETTVETETEELDEQAAFESTGAEETAESSEALVEVTESEDDSEDSIVEESVDQEVENSSESNVQEAEADNSEVPQSEENATYKYNSETLKQELGTLSEAEQTAFIEENADDIEVDEEMLSQLTETLAADNEEINAEEVYAAAAGTASTMSLSQAITDINEYIAQNNFDVAEIQYDYMPGLPNYAYHSDYGWDPENGVVGKPEGVVLHDVGNDNSTIYGEIEYMTRNQENAFVHAFVDANNIIQVADTDYLAYGAGPVSNQVHMHVELVRHDNAHDFARSINNYADYIANLLYKYKLPAVSAEETGEGTLWSHVAVSHHLGGTASPDPYDYFARFGYEYNDVISLITNRYNDMYNKRTTPQISMPIEQGTTSLLAEVNANNLGLYESVTDVRTKNANNLLGQTFRVVRTATYNYDDYYLLEDENGVSLGWMYAGDLTTSAYVPEVEDDENLEEQTPAEPEVPVEPEENESDETADEEANNEQPAEEESNDSAEDNENDNQNRDEDNTNPVEADETSNNDADEDSGDENQNQEESSETETPEEPAQSEDDASDNTAETDNSTEESVENEEQNEEESENPVEDSADEGSEDESDNQSEENNNEEHDNSNEEAADQEAEVSDENDETAESDTASDGDVSSSLEDAATGIRVVSASDELEGKSLVVTMLNPSNAIGAAHDLYDIHILDEDGSLYSLNNPVTVYLPANGYVSNVYYLGDIGETLESVNFRTEDGYAVFDVNSFSQYAVVYGNENEDNTNMAPVTGDKGTGGEETADQANEHPTVYTEQDVNSEDEAAAAGSDHAHHDGSGGAKEAEMLPDTGVAEQSTTIFATILAALGLGFLVKRRKTTEK